MMGFPESVNYERDKEICQKGKLTPRYLDPYKILKRIGMVAYEFELPVELAVVHLVFHISQVKKCMSDPASIIPL